MNEQIQLLMKQAGTDTSGKWMGIDHAEKFAELIVRECSGIVQNYMSRWSEDCDLVIKIKEHFGVEE
jgi:hypothetical protein